MNTTSQKPWKGIGMDGMIARWYAKTRRNDLADFQREAAAAAAQLRPGSSVLEVAPGPGFFAIELARLGDFHISFTHHQSQHRVYCRSGRHRDL